MNFNVKKGDNTFITVIDDVKVKQKILQIVDFFNDIEQFTFSLLDVQNNTLYYFIVYSSMLNYDKQNFETDFSADKNIIDYYIKDNEFLIYYVDIDTPLPKYGYRFPNGGETNIFNLVDEVGFTNFEGFNIEQPFTFFANYKDMPIDNQTSLFCFFSMLNGLYGSQGFSINLEKSGGVQIEMSFLEIGNPSRSLIYKSLRSNFSNTGIIQITYDGLKNNNSAKFYSNGNLASISQIFNTNNLTNTKPANPQVRIGNQIVGNPVIQNVSIVNFVKTTAEMNIDIQNGFQQKNNGDYIFNLDLNRNPGTLNIPAITLNNQRTLFTIENNLSGDFVLI